MTVRARSKTPQPVSDDDAPTHTHTHAHRHASAHTHAHKHTHTHEHMHIPPPPPPPPSHPPTDRPTHAPPHATHKIIVRDSKGLLLWQCWHDDADIPASRTESMGEHSSATAAAQAQTTGGWQQTTHTLLSLEMGMHTSRNSPNCNQCNGGPHHTQSCLLPCTAAHAHTHRAHSVARSHSKSEKRRRTADPSCSAGTHTRTQR